MTSYTGTQSPGFGPEPEFIKQFCQMISDGNKTKRSAATYWEPLVFKFRIAQSATAIGTDDYIYTAFKSPRAMIIMGCWLVDPVGISVDATNYNTYTLIQSGTTVCSMTSARGIIANLPKEVPLANTEANRTLIAHEEVTFKIAGTVAGAVINENTEVWVICKPA